MLNAEQSVEITVLHRHGMSIRALVDITGCARNTIRKYLRSEGKPALKERAKRTEKLDPFKPYLIRRIESAKPDWIPATSLLEEIQNQGYEGGITRLRQFLVDYKPATAPAEPDNRFETDPGKQMQVDWVVFRRGKDRLSAFVATMGYSRASFVEYVTDEKIETLLACHEHAFEYFGGVPKQVLYDNMKTVVIERDGYGEGNHKLNPLFLDFAKHWGFVPKLCQPYRARTKGKVERFNRYLRRTFHVTLASRLKMSGIHLDKDTANVEVRRWLRETANVRIHATTKEQPDKLLKAEQPHLQAFPPSYTGVSVREQSLTKPVAHVITPLQRPLSFYDELVAAAA
ncbi:transposase [Azospira sp. I13]|jgi:transposase|uniref:IS21 family transposase n=1 Tax=Rhodocyclales TaxID=206389 RepID=UPI000D44361A|nr:MULTISPECIES: IS21 family transposase [Rhodocyclales]GBG03654.1 transposase [Azospira sp. I13]